MDWYDDCAYEPDRKRQFHATARARLPQLANALRFAPGEYEIRSQLGGVAVSGEIVLHCTNVYVQICQPATRADSGILIRACDGRKDTTGGRNHFAALRLLDEMQELAARVRAVMASKPTSSRAA